MTETQEFEVGNMVVYKNGLYGLYEILDIRKDRKKIRIFGHDQNITVNTDQIMHAESDGDDGYCVPGETQEPEREFQIGDCVYYQDEIYEIVGGNWYIDREDGSVTESHVTLCNDKTVHEKVDTSNIRHAVGVMGQKRIEERMNRSKETIDALFNEESSCEKSPPPTHHCESNPNPYKMQSIPELDPPAEPTKSITSVILNWIEEQDWIHLSKNPNEPHCEVQIEGGRQYGKSFRQALLSSIAKNTNTNLVERMKILEERAKELEKTDEEISDVGVTWTSESTSETPGGASLVFSYKTYDGQYKNATSIQLEKGDEIRWDDFDGIIQIFVNSKLRTKIWK